MSQSSPLAGRYRFLKRLSAGPPRTVWLAEDETSGTLVIVVRIANRFARLLSPVVGVQHPHLACLLEIVANPAPNELPEEERSRKPSPFAVAEWVSGQTLYDALIQDPIARYQAVQTIAYVASAVSAVHTNNAFHGAISARSVVLDRYDEGPGPVLTQVIMPADGSYACPERLAGKGPGQPDDVWALHALLYAALTGQRPFRARTRQELLKVVENASPVPLEVFGIRDVILQSIIDRGFSPNPTQRTTAVQALETDLFSWLSAHSSEQAIAHQAIAQADQVLGDSEGADAQSAEAKTVMQPAPMQAALASMTIQGSPLGDDPSQEATDEPILPPSVQSMPAVSQTSAAEPAQPTPDQPAPDQPAPDQPAPAEPIQPSGDHPVEQGQPQPTPARPAQPDDSAPVAKATPPPRASTGKNRRAGRFLPAVLAVIGFVAVAAAATGGYLYVAAGEGRGTASSGAATTASVAPAVASMASATRPTRSTVPPASSMAPAPAMAAAPAASSLGSEPSVQDVSACVAGHFSAATFGNPQDLSFVCEEANPRKGATKMRAKLVRGSAGKLTDGMNMWSRMLWHELSAYGMIRRKCCAGAAVELPDPKPGCPSLEEAVNALSTDYVKGADLERSRKAFVEAATCTHRIQDRTYRYRTGPLSGGQVSFEKFVKGNVDR